MEEKAKWHPKNEEERVAYYRERILNQMELTEDDFTIELSTTGRFGAANFNKFQIFKPTKDGDIEILVYSIDGQVIEYPAVLNKTQRESANAEWAYETYKVVRYHPEHVEDGKKYDFPKGQGIHPFFPPKLVEKFRNNVDIPMLILTEGYFKAMCGSMHGFDIVGLGSITHYAETGTRKLHRDIARLIDRCNVKTVVILYDGDCLNISLKDLDRKEELTRRPKSFLSALHNTREILSEYDVNIYFAHVLTDDFDVENPPKGLDDLLMHPAFKDKRKAIREDLEGLSKRGEYFYKQNIKAKVSKLQDYFFLRNVEQFYRQWSEEIGEKEFMYYGSVYKYDSAKKVLIRIVPQELRNYLRAGDEYYEKVLEPSPINPNILELKLKHRKKGTIIDDFGRGMLERIQRYKGFVYIADHKNYQQVYHDFYNRYFPLNWKEEHRPFPYIQRFLKQVFGPGDGSEEDDQLELGYDYLQLLYQKPQHILPILCLVSKDRGSGKTTFLTLLRLIFGDNVVLIDNSTMNSEFNSLFAGRLVVAIDESSFKGNKMVMEKLKNLSTSPTLALNEKGKDQQIIANFSKFILTSNDCTDFITTDKSEVRFWVRKLKSIPDKELIPNIKALFEDEIPGLLYFLNCRKMSVPEELTRMWFTKEQIHTKALDDLVNDNRPPTVKIMAEALTQLFIDFPELEYIVSIGVIRELADLSDSKVNDDYMRKYLKEYFLATEVRNEAGIHGSKYIKIPYFDKDTGSTKYYKDKARAYTIRAEAVLDKDEFIYVKKCLDAKPKEQEIEGHSSKEDDPNYIPRGNE